MKSLRDPLNQRHLHVVESGQRLRDDKLKERIDETRGAWKAGHGDDPQRWLVRIVPDAANGFAIAPLDVQGYRLGIANAKTGRGPTAGVVVRITAFIAVDAQRFQLQADWGWLLWFVLEKPLTEAVGNSARMNRFNVAEKTIAFGDTTVKFTEFGLVGLLNAETQVRTAAFQQPLVYGDVTKRLAEFIEAGAPDDGNAADEDDAPAPADGGANA